MAGFIIILVCNVILFALIRWYMDSNVFKDNGEHRLSNVFILGMFVFWFFSGSVGAAIFVGQATTGSERFAYGAVAILTALPWVLPFIMLFTDGASSSVVDSLYGGAREGVDEADLRTANELLRNGMRDEAIAELQRLRSDFPESPNARFVLAALAEDENDYSVAAKYYREILQRCHDQFIPWTNAARASAAYHSRIW
jgi:tetratricopeptide (TPR) repeat protein